MESKLSCLLIIFFTSNVYLQNTDLDFTVKSVDLYNPSKEVCCNGYVFKMGAHPTQCCGNEIFDSSSSRCCVNNTLVKGPSDSENVYRHLCCDKSLYLFERQVCCNGKIFDIPPGFSSVTHSCCGDLMYNSETHICCLNKLFEKHGQSLKCCGGETYDENSHLCCGEYGKRKKLHSRITNTTECCGFHYTYDRSTEICCSNTVHQFPKYADKIHISCCWESLIVDDRKQICCEGGSVQNRPSEKYWCCEHRPYNFDNEVCCGRYVFPKTSNHTACCGETPYEDDGSKVCCGSRIFPTPNPSEGEKICCNGDLYPVTETGQTSCCYTYFN